MSSHLSKSMAEGAFPVPCEQQAIRLAKPGMCLILSAILIEIPFSFAHRDFDKLFFPCPATALAYYPKSPQPGMPVNTLISTIHMFMGQIITYLALRSRRLSLLYQALIKP